MKKSEDKSFFENYGAYQFWIGVIALVIAITIILWGLIESIFS